MKEALFEKYNKILKYCKENGLPEDMVKQCGEYASGLWESYEPLIRSIPEGIRNKVVVDFGCKYGLLFPLFFEMGAREAIGIDVVDEYIQSGKVIFETLYDSTKIVYCRHGYIPLATESMDVVFMNEVISHVNPRYLETVFSETFRTLKNNGIVYISDGNNLYNAECKESLVALYDAWENGPDGVKTDRDVVTKCFLNRRIEIVRERHPNLGDSKVQYLARNTSGLFGEDLADVIDEYVKIGRLIERPYRKGMFPTNPSSNGEVMERGFFPRQVELTLANYGFDTYQIRRRPVSRRVGLIGRSKDLYVWGRDRMKRLITARFESTESANFQIVGIKRV